MAHQQLLPKLNFADLHALAVCLCVWRETTKKSRYLGLRVCDMCTQFNQAAFALPSCCMSSLILAPSLVLTRSLLLLVPTNPPLFSRLCVCLCVRAGLILGPPTLAMDSISLLLDPSADFQVLLGNRSSLQLSNLHDPGPQTVLIDFLGTSGVVDIGHTNISQTTHLSLRTLVPDFQNWLVIRDQTQFIDTDPAEFAGFACADRDHRLNVAVRQGARFASNNCDRLGRVHFFQAGVSAKPRLRCAA